MNTNLIIVETPHSGNPLAWHAIDERDFINKVKESTLDRGFHYDEYTTENMEDLLEVYDGELPAEMAKILAEHGHVIETVAGHGDDQHWHSPDSAPSEFAFYAEKVLGSDLRSSDVMTVAEAREFVSKKDSPEAIAVGRVLADYF